MPDLWLKFYPKDWNGDLKLRGCSLAARGLWASLLEPMHAAVPYGHLLINGKQPTLEQLAGVASCKAREVEYLLRELITTGVASVTEEGVVFSRRMVRDAERLAKRRANGRAGGNPQLQSVVNHQDNHQDNHPHNQMVPPMASGVLVSGSHVLSKNEDEPFDVQWEQFKAAYPAPGRSGGYMAERRFLEACQRVGFPALLAAVQRYAASETVRKGFVVRLEKWLEQERWLQAEDTHETAKAQELDRVKAELDKIDARRASLGRA